MHAMHYTTTTPHHTPRDGQSNTKPIKAVKTARMQILEHGRLLLRLLKSAPRKLLLCLLLRLRAGLIADLMLNLIEHAERLRRNSLSKM